MGKFLFFMFLVLRELIEYKGQLFKNIVELHFLFKKFSVVNVVCLLIQL